MTYYERLEEALEAYLGTTSNTKESAEALDRLVEAIRWPERP